MMASLNPDQVLERGYVRVTGADGQTLVSMATAQKESSLSLHFRDGALRVAPATPVKPTPSPRQPKPNQDDLFG